MDEDFGLLVDFLLGELDAESASALCRRLENEKALFLRLEKLRRTYALLRVLPKPLVSRRLRA